MTLASSSGGVSCTLISSSRSLCTGTDSGTRQKCTSRWHQGGGTKPEIGGWSL